ncbi:hypothetical protein KP509_01G038200 [Ceratopteris richardii]|uniref:Uncharacterized protein n=1 Tax=Ceratopteris richardii TaxID=49495 RepID=A0A8T2VG49_CERRI|nr:hypothetical protein KP509_01G038200 [Ceratopteris richardii]
MSISETQAPKIRISEDHSLHRKHKHHKVEHDRKKSRHDRRDHKNKRKKESENISKKRHRDEHRSSHRSSKSSKKANSKHKQHRHRHDSSEIDSNNIGNFKEGQSGGDVLHHSIEVSKRRSRSPIRDIDVKDRSKRFRVEKAELNIGANGEDHDAVKNPSKRPEATRSVRFKGETTITKGQEREREFEGRKDKKVLEGELREKALANFMRHHDTSYRKDDHSPVNTRQSVACSEETNRALPEAETKNLVNAGNAVDHYEDTIGDTVARANDECFGDEKSSNLEEGEIVSDTSIENKVVTKDSSLAIDEGEVLHESRNKLGNTVREDSEVAKTNRNSLISEKQDSSQGQMVKESLMSASPSTQQVGNNDSGNTNSFQEKTMSVMRGGEMVQVSYKVYIPKRAAELAARRRLRR